MTTPFRNVYDDEARAAAYARLEFPGTYYLAFRDLPDIIRTHARGTAALDFGCGAGRSTRFLKSLGFDAVGIDISEAMLERARAADPDGEYLLVTDDYTPLGNRRFDVILSAFAFDNIPDAANRARLMTGLRGLLAPGGHVVLLGSTPEIYTHEWASFSTSAFAGNRVAKSGDTVCTVMKDVPDARPVIDILWLHADYLDLFSASGLTVVREHRPLGRPEEPQPWISETRVAPWVIYVARAAG
jgi:SAM-dependent methyltransferase